MTTASLHREMVEALRASDAGEECWDRFDEGEPDVCQWDPVCWEHRRRAALEGWEKRPRLRDTYELISAVFGLLAEQDAERRVDRSFAYQVTHRTQRAVAILDALDPLLYGERG